MRLILLTRAMEPSAEVLPALGLLALRTLARLRGLRQRYDGRRLWALFEPRSNTSRRNVLQNELIEALTEADGSVIAAVANPEKVAADQRLDTAKVAQSVTSRGSPCWFEANTEAIVKRLKQETRSGDVIVVFSNGGFDGIHDKLLNTL